jgi:hypothetical protein
MRVRHLTDFEIQGMMDRRHIATTDDVPGQVYLKDLDSQEHLDRCPACQAEVNLYRELYVDLGTVEEVSLPKNFARDVTFSLPPFTALRTRSRLQMAAAWGMALLVSLFWFAGRIDWAGLLTKGVVFLAPKVAAVQLWVNATVGDISLPAFELPKFEVPNLWAALVTASEVAQQAFFSESASVNFMILAAVALVLIGSLDKLYQTAASRQKDLQY